MSRWLVGSSSIMKFRARRSSSFASAIRIRMPPENSATSRARSSSLKPSPNSTDVGAALGAVEVVTLEFAQHVAQFVERGVVRRARMMRGENLFEFDLRRRSSACISLERRERLVAAPSARPSRARPAAGSRRGCAAGARYGPRRAAITSAIMRSSVDLAGAVEADQADPPVVGHRPAHAVEDRAAAVEL